MGNADEPKRSLIDRAIESIAPRWGRRRRWDRQMLSLTDDGYTITQPQRTRRRFSGGGGGADVQDTPERLWQLREISRKHDRQSALMAGMLNTAVSEIVGPKFSFHSASKNEAFNEAATQWIAEQQRAEICDVRGERTFTDIVKSTLRTVWVDGDLLHRRVRGGALQTWEAHQIASPRSQDDAGTRTVNGLQKNSAGRTVAYYVTKAGQSAFQGFVESEDTTQRIPANQCWFPAYLKRFNQSRGVPFIAPVLTFYDRFNQYLEDEAFAAEMNAKLGLQITHQAVDTNEPPGTEDRTDPNASTNTETSFDRVLRMEAGQVFDMNVGEDVGMIGSHRPGDTFEPYVTMACRIIGAGIGFPIELFLKDFSKTNYSSAKAALEVTHRQFQGWQEFLCTKLCLPWYAWQIDRGIASRALPPIPDAHKAQCVWPSWAFLDPEKEAKAHRIMLEDRTESAQQIIREGGRDPDEVTREIKIWEKIWGGSESAPAAPAPPSRPDDEPPDIPDEEPGQ